MIASPDFADKADFERLLQIVETSNSSRPENMLAFVGDKHIYYGPDGQTALAYADIGRLRIAMGPPLGPQKSRKSAIEAFCVTAQKNRLRPVIYAAPPDLLPDLTALNFTVEKIGENAILDLPGFSLSGRKRETMRRSRRKLTERMGASFEVSLPPHSEQMIEGLRRVSDLWLQDKGGREKSFSIGRFDHRFLNRCPIGIVTIDGKIIAFASVLITPDKSWAAIDLMRYDPEAAVTNTMDYLLAELILWAKASGYHKFDLAMAPLSGMDQAGVSLLYARIGQFMFEYGERFYNFKGLKRFKQKFDPVWEPRYIAAPGYWSLPIVLMQVRRLTQGRDNG